MMQRGGPVGSRSCAEYAKRNKLTFGPHARGSIVARSEILVMTCKEGLQIEAIG